MTNGMGYRLRNDGSNERGLTLIEVLMAVSLLAVGFAGILSTYTTSLLIQKQVDDRARALFIAQQVLEEAATIPYEDLEYGYELDYYDDEIAGELFVVREVNEVTDDELGDLWTRYPDPDPYAAYKMVVVRVNWGFQEGGDEPDTVNLTWLRVRRENTVEMEEKVSTQAL